MEMRESKKFALIVWVVTLIVIMCAVGSTLIIPDTQSKAYPMMSTPTALPTQAWPVMVNDLIFSDPLVPMQVYGTWGCSRTGNNSWIAYAQRPDWPGIYQFRIDLFEGTGGAPDCLDDDAQNSCQGIIDPVHSWLGSQAMYGIWTWNDFPSAPPMTGDVWVMVRFEYQFNVGLDYYWRVGKWFSWPCLNWYQDYLPYIVEEQ